MTKLSPSAADERIIVGKIGAPHGVKGELKIIPLTDFPERFAAMKNLTVGAETFTIENSRTAANGNPLIKLSGINDRDAAARLTGQRITVAKSEAMPLKEGEYYAFDIVGLRVFDENGNDLGVVTDVLKTGSNDVYAVKDNNGRELLVPALKKVVGEIDTINKRMTITANAEEYRR